MYSKNQITKLVNFLAGNNKDPFTKIMRAVLYGAYFSTAIGGALAGNTMDSSGPWWEILGSYLVIGGTLTILIGHSLLAYASYRQQPQFKKPNDAAVHMFKSIALYIYLPAIVITAILIGVALLVSK